MKYLATLFVFAAMLLTVYPSQSDVGTGLMLFHSFFDVADAQLSSSITPEQNQQILRLVFGADYEKSGCHSVIDRVEASLTSRNARETIYVLECSPPLMNGVTDNQNSNKLAVFSGEQLITVVDFFGTGISRVSDINDDGINELLLYDRWKSKDEAGITAQLVDLKGGQLHYIADFGKVQNIMCSEKLGTESKRIIYSSIHVFGRGTKERYPHFVVEYFEGACPDKNGKVDWSKLRRMPDKP